MLLGLVESFMYLAAFQTQVFIKMQKITLRRVITFIRG